MTVKKIKTRLLSLVCMLIICATSVGLLISALKLLQKVDSRIKLHELAQHWKLLTFRRSQLWGLGNEMFALASTSCIAEKYRGKWLICLDAKAEVRRAFNLTSIPVCDAETMLDELQATGFKEESYAIYDPRVETLHVDTHLVLDRFFQSWRYFVDCDADIRRLFTFQSTIWSRARQELIFGIQQTLGCSACVDDIIKIGVHVRRGNMASDTQLENFGYTVADSAYIAKALKYIVDEHLQHSQHPYVIVVVSDDMRWCRDNLSHIHNVFFLLTDDAVVDMAVLSQSQHVVMTVGTFGWWAAWLSNSNVVYYSNWPRKGSWLDKATSHKDYFLPDWIAM